MPGVVLWAARHAPVDAEGVCYGRSDVAVRVPHADAAGALAATLADRPEVVWSSPAPRCRLLAEALASGAGVPARAHPGLHELDFGAWEGRRWTAIERDDAAAYAAWLEGWLELPPPGGERPRDLEARVRAWAAGLSPGVHALVAHAGVVRALRVVVEGRSWSDAMQTPVPHLVWTRLALPD